MVMAYFVIFFMKKNKADLKNFQAGSDLDGDEYSVIWDPALFLEKTEAAFDFTSTDINEFPGDKDEVKANFSKYMIEFFTTYISKDSIGSISNGHLANSDLYDINAEVSRRI